MANRYLTIGMVCQECVERISFPGQTYIYSIVAIDAGSISDKAFNMETLASVNPAPQWNKCEEYGGLDRNLTSKRLLG